METLEYIHTDNLSEENIPNAVIAICAINATLRTKGVVSLTGGLTDSISENIFKKELLSKGVKVDQDEDGIILDVYVVIKYGAKIPQVAWEIQENVKNEVETMTDRKVAAVNIHVQKIQLNDNKRKGK
jgi:uncharacterized alkaline shock family protein YloU